MSDMYDVWQNSKAEVEQQMRSAGLTKETLDKINAWMEKKAKEDKDDSDK